MLCSSRSTFFELALLSRCDKTEHTCDALPNQGQVQSDPCGLLNSKLTYWSMGLASVQTVLWVVLAGQIADGVDWLTNRAVEGRDAKKWARAQQIQNAGLPKPHDFAYVSFVTSSTPQLSARHFYIHSNEHNSVTQAN